MEKKNTLKTRNLGGMEVSALGFGCMNFVWAYGHVMGKEEAITANRGLLDILKGVAAKYDATPAQIQLAWELAKKPFIVPIPGTTRIDHLDENLGALNINLSREDVEYLDRESAAFKVAGALTTEELGESLDDMTE